MNKTLAFLVILFFLSILGVFLMQNSVLWQNVRSQASELRIMPVGDKLLTPVNQTSLTLTSDETHVSVGEIVPVKINMTGSVPDQLKVSVIFDSSVFRFIRLEPGNAPFPLSSLTKIQDTPFTHTRKDGNVSLEAELGSFTDREDINITLATLYLAPIAPIQTTNVQFRMADTMITRGERTILKKTVSTSFSIKE